MWEVKKLGLIDFQEAFELQKKLVKKKQEGDEINYFLLCEHYPVFTRGKGSKEDNILDKDTPVVLINRGGDLTCHEPGQLVGYIILDLKKEKLNVKTYLSKIESLIINTLKKLDIEAYSDPELVGVWVNNAGSLHKNSDGYHRRKIASIGIGISKGITMHGFALNINNNMKGFEKINPCGLNADTMTSVHQLKKSFQSIESIQQILERELEKTFP